MVNNNCKILNYLLQKQIINPLEGIRYSIRYSKAQMFKYFLDNREEIPLKIMIEASKEEMNPLIDGFSSKIDNYYDVRNDYSLCYSFL